MARLSHGKWVRLPRGAAAGELTDWERAALLQPMLGPQVAVAGATAAEIWRIPISRGPSWIDHRLGETAPTAVEDGRLHFAFTGERRNQQCTEYVIHKSLGMPLRHGPWDCLLTHPVETVLRLQPTLRGWRSVVALDYILATGFEYAPVADPSSVAEITALVDTLPPGTRGIATLRKALGQVLPNVWSPMETVLRLLLVQAGVPLPQANLRIGLPGGGSAHLDLAWEAAMVGLEYNGEIHYRDRRAYGDEMHRINRLQDLGWQLRLVVAEDLRDPARFAALLRWLEDRLG